MAIVMEFLDIAGIKQYPWARAEPALQAPADKLDFFASSLVRICVDRESHRYASQMSPGGRVYGGLLHSTLYVNGSYTSVGFRIGVPMLAFPACKTGA